jgi:lipid-binding SYLF domain-containing protein
VPRNINNLESIQAILKRRFCEPAPEGRDCKKFLPMEDLAEQWSDGADNELQMRHLGVLAARLLQQGVEAVMHRRLHSHSAALAALICGALSASLITPSARGAEKTQQRLQDAAEVFSQVMATPDKGIPEDLVEKAQCVVIVPGVKKGAFIVGGEYGKGFLTCRPHNERGWSAPAAVRIEGGSVGLQAGGSETDVILMVMNQQGEEKLLQSQFTLGGEGEVAAGPVGRTVSAKTDAKLTAGILSWSRSRGVFAGAALQGATLRQDLDDNQTLYGKKLENREIVMQHVTPPTGAQKLLDLLNRYSPAKGD